MFLELGLDQGDLKRQKKGEGGEMSTHAARKKQYEKQTRMNHP